MRRSSLLPSWAAALIGAAGLCVTAVALFPVIAQAQKLYVTPYTPAQGLPAETVQAVTRDAIGFLWVATDNGLARFDGQRFQSFQHAIESRYIKALLQRPDSTLLVASDAGVHVVTPRRDTAHVRPLVAAHPRPTDSTVVYPNALFQDAGDRVWISQPNGSVARLDGDRLRFFPFGADHATGASDSGFVFASDRQDRVWTAAETGPLYRLDPDTDRFERVALPASFRRVHALTIRNDTLWMAGSGLLRARVRDDGRLTDIRTFSTGGRVITHLAFGLEGLLVGTRQRGLFLGTFPEGRLDLQEVFAANDPHRVETLPFSTINHVHVDRDGSIWVSSPSGLGLLQSRFFQTVSGLTNNNVFSVYPMGAQRILVSFGEVYDLRPDERRFAVRSLAPSDPGFATSLTATGSTLWMSIAGGRVLASRNGRFQPAADLSDRGSDVFYMHGDRRGDVWLCQAPADAPLKGVSKIASDGTVRFYDADDGVDNRILIVREGPRGTLYAAGIGPETYLYRYQPDRDRFINLSLPLPFAYSQNFEVHDLAVDPRGIVWLATTDGLLRYDLERIQRIELGPFTETEIRSVSTMPDGSIWMATDTHGLLHYRDGTWVQFDEDSGLPTKVASYRALRVDDRGRLWVGTAEGVVYSRDPQPAPQPTPMPMLQAATVGGEPAVPAERLSLRTGNRLRLRYATLTFPGHDLRYQYRLSGAEDTTWSDPMAASTLTLDDLPLGEHTLELRARNGSGHRWSAPLRLPLDVRPVWYRTGWAYALYLLGAIGAVAYAIRFRTNYQHQRIQELEAALREKERELERHHETMEAQSEHLEEMTAELSSKREAVEAARGNLALLHELIERLPRNVTWSHVLDALGTTVEATDGIDAVEIGYHQDGEIIFAGYEQRRHAFVHREAEFNERTHLAVWSLVRDEPLVIEDYRAEHTQFIQPQGEYQYQSAMYVPFAIPGRQQLILIVYGLHKHAFDEKDLMMAQIFADYLSATVKSELQPSIQV